MIKKKILIIDDQKELAEMAGDILEETGLYEIRTETKSIQGLDVARVFEPDLILLDIVMPNLGGAELADQLEHDKKCQGIPIIFMTSLITGEEAHAHGGAIAGHPFISKPVSAEELRRRIAEILRKPF